MRTTVREVPMTREVQAHAIRIVLATHPDTGDASPLAKKFVRYGASPRGVQALILAAKIYALLDGRYPRVARRHRKSRAAVVAAPHHPQLRGRGGGCDQRARAGGNSPGNPLIPTGGGSRVQNKVGAAILSGSMLP